MEVEHKVKTNDRNFKEWYSNTCEAAEIMETEQHQGTHLDTQTPHRCILDHGQEIWPTYIQYLSIFTT